MLRTSTLALALSAGWVLPAHAAASKDTEVARQLAEMRAALDALNQRVGTLEGDLANAKARADAAEARATSALAQADAAKAAVAAVPAASVTAKPATELTWDGAPKLATKDGWTFKPRGRLHIDAGGVSAPGAYTASTLGSMRARVRRARLGFEGTVPGGLGYKVEADLANGSVGFGDVWLTYTPGNAPVVLRIGNFETLNSMEQISSSNFNSFIERATFNDAFTNARRMGAALAYKSANNDLRAEAGLFTGHSIDSSLDNNGWIGAARLVYAPQALGGQLHFGVNYQYRDFASNISGGTSTGTAMPSTNQLARYRARPNSQLTDVRFVDTGNFAASSDQLLGLEAMAVFKGLYLASEAQWVKAKGYRAGDLATGAAAFSGGNSAVVPVSDPGFFGAYGEVGYFLTGETRGYKRGDGTWARTKVLNPISKGGSGAFQIAARYEYLDLNDDALIGGATNNFTTGTSALAALNSRLGRGGTQSSYLLGLNWYPSDYVRFLVNYGHLSVTGGPLAALVDPASTLPVNDRKYGVNVLQTRMQIDF
ncbi:OprO/OprP family phosphate-selective porin [Novosphingobium sp. B 225]|uniref:OprO/OprP family phosphate-selective porin n=1 Tax=Novosphingobium sp. B 225 TaxID=1961849 RepID=UPI000B4A97CD|nr:porin [Novosphingobium sp. B 225]